MNRSIAVARTRTTIHDACVIEEAADDLDRAVLDDPAVGHDQACPTMSCIWLRRSDSRFNLSTMVPTVLSLKPGAHAELAGEPVYDGSKQLVVLSPYRLKGIQILLGQERRHS